VLTIQFLPSGGLKGDGGRGGRPEEPLVQLTVALQNGWWCRINNCVRKTQNTVRIQNISRNANSDIQNVWCICIRIDGS